MIESRIVDFSKFWNPHVKILQTSEILVSLEAQVYGICIT